uniref:uncharacterized protein LOC118151035 isoform X2 n=1 Tax=Callithrix jacchus TaxID=9483 RepID=UPI0023DD54DA|nr:uncharacterized protein LOC118151035 isoform X2 [Callithrix jacchus]XP_054098369.1 uncharacterized protein LOC118151035 isoform X2 [Callithrix jacchus]XP_054098370.1 uncharacterized protein LOC118151035 isoform X2 [Callithrix jacchus]
MGQGRGPHSLTSSQEPSGPGEAMCTAHALWPRLGGDLGLGGNLASQAMWVKFRGSQPVLENQNRIFSAGTSSVLAWTAKARLGGRCFSPGDSIFPERQQESAEGGLGGGREAEPGGQGCWDACPALCRAVGPELLTQPIWLLLSRRPELGTAGGFYRCGLSPGHTSQLAGWRGLLLARQEGRSCGLREWGGGLLMPPFRGCLEKPPGPWPLWLFKVCEIRIRSCPGSPPGKNAGCEGPDTGEALYLAVSLYLGVSTQGSACQGQARGSPRLRDVQGRSQESPRWTCGRYVSLFSSPGQTPSLALQVWGCCPSNSVGWGPASVPPGHSSYEDLAGVLRAPRPGAQVAWRGLLSSALTMGLVASEAWSGEPGCRAVAVPCGCPSKVPRARWFRKQTCPPTALEATGLRSRLG